MKTLKDNLRRFGALFVLAAVLSGAVASASYAGCDCPRPSDGDGSSAGTSITGGSIDTPG